MDDEDMGRMVRANTVRLSLAERVIGRLLGAADFAGRHVTTLPGLAALGCAVVGVGMVTHTIGWALLAAVPFLLAADRRI